MSAPVAERAGADATPAISRYLAVGLLGGLFSGLLGIGGGTVMVPLMVLWLAETQRHAHALSLAAIIPISIAAVAVYGGAGKVDVTAALALTVGSVVGARFGARLLAGAPERPLKAAFGLFLLFAAAALVLEG